MPPPSESIHDWPFVGEPVYTVWLSASQNLTGTLAQYTPHLEGLRDGLIATAAGAGSGMVQLLFSVIIAGIFLATATQSVAGIRTVTKRLVGPDGERLLSVSEKTVRSVAQGVVGVAIIQAIFASIGLVVAGVPAAGLWTLLVVMLAIVQLSPLIILGPIIVYVFSVMDPFGATVFAIYSIIVSGCDTFLRPMLLGRGLDVPMLVILLGAIGGMILAGIVGLFAGAVILVLGYELVEFWLNKSGASSETVAPDASP
jgi:predicted PurR-regulated permease PerM